MARPILSNSRIVSLAAAALALTVALLSAKDVVAAPYHLVLESNTDAGAGSEVFFVSYPTFADLVGDTNASGTFGGINIAPGFSIGGMTYDGTSYHLVLESDADAAANSEVFFVSYPSLADLIADMNSLGMFGAINVAPGFSIGGIAYDGSYRLLLESDTDAPANSEVFFVSYPTFADLVGDTNASGAFGAVNLAPGFSIGGLAYDGTSYRLVLESDADAAANSEVFFVSYPTFADLVGDTNASGTFGGINVAPSFSIGGATFQPSAGPNPHPVPTPATLLLLAAGGIGLFVSGARKGCVGKRQLAAALEG
jgi:hypothetical protein